ncbi:cell division protein FtsA [Lewinella marina]|uniref:Cell division protein FtsA n=1 Tax=Neolewinella marina TaxID=438751 RepID=A0A2G0CIZ1_9BACT|nr:cell division protein FtsA [Neolewinella marina]NJB84911.1 cell division protein FtsA [Neolewinella marina]PHK99936.1 cell division protein FtsA [Neolewinella marina]
MTDTTQTKTIAALDIGTTKVCALVGRRDEHGRVEILGTGKVDSEGVMRGVVTNIEKTVRAITEARRLAEQASGESIQTVHVGIAGQHIKSLQHRGMLMRDNSHSEISQRDIDRLIGDMHKLVLPPGDKILHVIPQEYTVDNEQGIVDPIGMSGSKLEANFHIITGQITASNNINRCVERSGLHMANVTLEPIASAASVLYEDEKQAGVALVDIGGGTTDITIFQEGIIRHTAVVPFGGHVITKDIKAGCTVMEQHAEKLKVNYGSALASEVYENRVIVIPGLRGREPKEISEKNLALIIQARAEEILDHVLWEIRRAGFDGSQLIGGIVLTGGGALLRDFDKLTELHTGMSARIGSPVEHLAHGYTERLTSPIYATGVGLLLQGFADIDAGRVAAPPVKKEEPVTELELEEQIKEEVNNPSWFDNVFKRTKEWFEAEPDRDF